MAIRVACIILLVGGEGISVEVECIAAKGKAPRIMAFAFCTTREDATCTIVTLGRGASMAIRMGRVFFLEDGLVLVWLSLGIDGMEKPRLYSLSTIALFVPLLFCVDSLRVPTLASEPPRSSSETGLARLEKEHNPNHTRPRASICLGNRNPIRTLSEP